ncbi:MAG: hypothetical protein WA688_07370 [Thermoplasmata archaeon]
MATTELTLSTSGLARIDGWMQKRSFAGPRYSDETMALIDR